MTSQLAAAARLRHARALEMLAAEMDSNASTKIEVVELRTQVQALQDKAAQTPELTEEMRESIERTAIAPKLTEIRQARTQHKDSAAV